MIRYIDDYRNKKVVRKLLDEIRKISLHEVSLMEVCGGHTMSIQKFGIPSLLPHNIKLLSGPGCPVCVSSRSFIDHAIAISRKPEIIVTTFGDLIRVPGSSSSLSREKASGNDIRIVYSILDAIELAKKNPEKHIVFLGIGFETTAPGTAIGVLNAAKLKLDNFSVLSSHKIMPPAMSALINEGVKIDGYIAPGHVSVITGTDIYEDLINTYKVACVISGFEPVDILKAIYMLIRQIETKDQKVEIAYTRAVAKSGNIKAREAMKEVFRLNDDWWRGLGILPESGLELNDKYAQFNSRQRIEVEVEPTKEDKGCICGEILKGIKTPSDCKLFSKVCRPDNPVGACMVSNEGACHAYYRYNRNVNI